MASRLTVNLLTAYTILPGKMLTTIGYGAPAGEPGGGDEFLAHALDVPGIPHDDQGIAAE